MKEARSNEQLSDDLPTLLYASLWDNRSMGGSIDLFLHTGRQTLSGGATVTKPRGVV